MKACMTCQKTPLKPIEVALHKKLINRGATDFLCLSCLAKFYQTDEATLLAKAEEFKAMGCTLFA